MFQTLVFLCVCVCFPRRLAFCQVLPAGAMLALLSLCSSDVDAVNQLEFILVFLGSSVEENLQFVSNFFLFIEIC